MKLRKILYLVASTILFGLVFLIDAISKNIEVELGLLSALRGALVIAGFVFIYLLIEIGRDKTPPTQVQRIGRIALWAGAFIALYIFVRILPINWFESREFRLFPRDYLTILFSALLSIAGGTVAIMTMMHMKEMLLYKRKKGTKRNYWILLGVFFGAAISTYNLRPLETSVYTTLLFVLAVLMIIVNSFRLSWIAYLSRREKIYGMLYSLIAFFLFMALNIMLSESDKSYLEKALLYFSFPVRTFVQLTFLFGSVYFGMTFISTLFHLPTAEAFDRKQTELSSLHNLSRLITQVFDLRELGDTVIKMTFEVCEASSAWLEIIPTSQTVNSQKEEGIVSYRNITSDIINTVLYGDANSVRAHVVATKKVLLIDQINSDRRTKYIGKVKNMGSMLVVPLLSHKELIGILYATKSVEFGFDQDDIDVLSGFADHASIAIENAKLIERSLEKERLQRELMLAQEMQKRLLPQAMPVNSSLEMRAISAPALEVGGDYYDVIELGNDRLGIVIGDVSGKGVGAAFYMAEVKGIFQSLSKICSSPREFLIKANEALVSSIDKRSFISLIYAIVNSKDGELILSRAGHCPMLHVTPTSVEYIKPTGMGLGLVKGKLFADAIEERHIQLHQGDICVFYTDGVTESRSSGGDEFGYDRLLEVVERNRAKSADEIKEEIIQSVWRYTDAQGYDDDLTVLVLKWNG